MTDADKLARQRFFAIALLRLAGAMLAVIGLVTLAGRTTLPPEAGIGFVLIGLADFLLVPRFLARKWKSPQP
ncbi:MAG: hypothetical protein ACK4YM_00710 [Novosphingobium sp.]